MNDEVLYHVLIPHPKDHAILVRNDGYLPVIRFLGCAKTQLEALCELVKEELGCSFGLFRIRKECEQFRLRDDCELYHQQKHDERRIKAFHRYWCTLLIFEITDKQDSTAPKNVKWIPQVHATEIHVEPPWPGVIEYLNKYTPQGLDINSDRLYPYSRVGWYDNAGSWIREELLKRGHDVKSITQLRSGADSCVLRVTSHSGLMFYMKAITPGGWYEEVKATCALSEVIPENFPKPLSYDLDREWLLMRNYGSTFDFGDFDLDENPELTERVLSKWAEIQKKSIPLAQRLVRSGVPMFEGKKVREEVSKMVEDPEWFDLQQNGMIKEEREQYNDENAYKDEYLAYIDRLLKELSEYKVPLTLVHGDLEPVNVIKGGETDYLFFDLFGTRVSFPFLDILQYRAGSRGDDMKSLDFYLKLWTEYETIERLRELFWIIADIQGIEYEIDCYVRYSKRRRAKGSIRVIMRGIQSSVRLASTRSEGFSHALTEVVDGLAGALYIYI